MVRHLIKCKLRGVYLYGQSLFMESGKGLVVLVHWSAERSTEIYLAYVIMDVIFKEHVSTHVK
jgi:hypothetical protein